tara:strand:- start:2414 stop:3556 length:1143 start_codon:yes stop_codon:yes gene_type:complete
VNSVGGILMAINNEDQKIKKPRNSRYTNVAKLVQNSVFSQDIDEIDTTQVESSGEIYHTVDLFAGCGGISKGFEDANFKSICAVEIDPDSAATYSHNFKDAHVFHRDINELTDAEVLREIGNKKVHVLMGGFPCQGFSVAGERKILDERNQLYKQMIRFAKLLNPDFVVGENVPGIYTMKGPEEEENYFMHQISNEFHEIGYNVSARVLESADFGVPQYRPRMIFIANKDKTLNPFPKKIIEHPKDHKTIEEIDRLMETGRDPSINHEWTNHKSATISKIKKVKPGYSLYKTYADAFKRQYVNTPSMTVKENHGGTHIHHKLHRCISAREMAILQSFPDDFFFKGTMKRAMFQIGNAVPPLLAKHVALALRPSLDKLYNE